MIDDERCPVALQLLEDAADGTAGCTRAVKYARVIHNRFGGESLREIGSLGTSICNNVERDLHVRARSLYDQDPMAFSIPIHGSPVEMKWFTLAPYETFAQIVKTSPAQLNKSLLGNRGELAPKWFWDNALRSEWGMGHEANTKYYGYRDKLVPLNNSSDEVEVYTNQPFHEFHVCSALVDDVGTDVWDTKHFIGILDERYCSSATLRRISEFY